MLQWFLLRTEEKRWRLGLNWIIWCLFMHNEGWGYQVCSLVSSNHGQTTRLLDGRVFGNLASEVISQIFFWLVIRWHKVRVSRSLLHRGRIEVYTGLLTFLDKGLLRIVAEVFKQMLIQYFRMQEDKMKLKSFEFTWVGSKQEGSAYLETNILFGKDGKSSHSHKSNPRVCRNSVLWDCVTMLVHKVLAWIFWLNFMGGWLRFQGIFKPKLNGSRELLRSFYNEST